MLKLLIPVILSVSACKKPNSDSQTQSLENLVAADGANLTVNTCEGPYINKEYKDGESFEIPKELEADFFKALSSIPLAMREIFSTQMLGKIVVSSDTKTDCRSATTNLSEERLKSPNLNTLSCLRSTPGEPGVELVIPADRKSLRHALVRGFFAAVFTTMSETNYQPKLKLFVAEKPDPELAEIKKALVVALRIDLDKAKSDPKRIEQLFGSSIAPLRDSKAIAAAFDTMSTSKKDDLSLTIIREAADQYYCSQKTREVMREKFATTYNIFKNRWVVPAHEMLEEKTPEEIYGEKS